MRSVGCNWNIVCYNHCTFIQLVLELITFLSIGFSDVVSEFLVIAFVFRVICCPRYHDD